MTARHSLARLVYEDPEMVALGFIQDRVWQQAALDTPEADAPFIVIVEDAQEKSFGTTGVDIISYWVHLPRSRFRDYTTINNAIEQLKTLMDFTTHLIGDDGWVLTAGSWVDTSRDLRDEVYDTIVKYATFRVASRSLVVP